MYIIFKQFGKKTKIVYYEDIFLKTTEIYYKRATDVFLSSRPGAHRGQAVAHLLVQRALGRRRARRRGVAGATAARAHLAADSTFVVFQCDLLND